MNSFKISEAARETGFSVSALRFYEQQGVVVPERTATGYRRYLETDLDSLRFVARAKKLGLTLDEITELLDLLDDDECEPVQTRIHELVNQRISQSQDHIANLVEFTAQLQRAAARLGLHTPDGACDEECGCRADPQSPDGNGERSFIPLAGTDSVDIACSLDPHLVGGRVDDWAQVLTAAKTREPIANGVRIGFDRDVDLVALTELAGAEQTCCSFFRFDIGIGPEGVTLAVTGPDDAQDVIVSIFGAAA